MASEEKCQFQVFVNSTLNLSENLAKFTRKQAGASHISTGTGNTLPQTGQLNWPVALFAALGVIFVVVGIVLVNTGRKRRSEA